MQKWIGTDFLHPHDIPERSAKMERRNGADFLHPYDIPMNSGDTLLNY
ncbi:Uncharacterized protein dnm_087260 [Desulfonema magnum]|uniref:Uncharacterized protein n=1 Tax=Desulfonema magnum TaxID=45655 RepID=A0A975GT26_9BACT|nr:Uncharacterized protein dnm_087260 [Desulfonema magnum]